MTAISTRFWPYPRLGAHRGAGKAAPENTLTAMRGGHAHGHGHMVAAVESLLRRWAVWCRHWQPDLGFPSSSTWAKLYAARHPVSSEEAADETDSHELHALDAAIADLPRHLRLAVELAWIARHDISQEVLTVAYAGIATGLKKRNVLL